jgi:2-C-methyl-D-erythritol 2,4-cyclodiphosphate synthase
MTTSQNYRIGFGEDAHRLASDRRLKLGGVHIPDSTYGTDAHSDGDVLLHALADALLSTHALGDIGQYFPPTDPALKDLDSAEIVMHVLQLLERHAPGFIVINAAAVITLDKPKLGSYREAMAETVAGLLGLEPAQVGVTFKTSEGLAPLHVQARVTVLVRTGS